MICRSQGYKDFTDVQLLVTKGMNFLEQSNIGFRNSKKKKKNNIQDRKHSKAYHYVKVKWYVELEAKEEKGILFSHLQCFMISVLLFS